MICTKLIDQQQYICKLGFDSEVVLFRTNGFTQTQNVCAQEIDQFLESMGAVKLEDRPKREWVSFNPRLDIYTFGTTEPEIHVVKREP